MDIQTIIAKYVRRRGGKDRDCDERVRDTNNEAHSKQASREAPCRGDRGERGQPYLSLRKVKLVRTIIKTTAR